MAGGSLLDMIPPAAEAERGYRMMESERKSWKERDVHLTLSSFPQSSTTARRYVRHLRKTVVPVSASTSHIFSLIDVHARALDWRLADTLTLSRHSRKDPKRCMQEKIGYHITSNKTITTSPSNRTCCYRHFHPFLQPHQHLQLHP